MIILISYTCFSEFIRNGFVLNPFFIRRSAYAQRRIAVRLTYITAVVDTQDLNVAAKLSRPVYCMPHETYVADIRRNLLQYCADHPDTHSSSPASEYVIFMLAAAYPCTPK
jgi:hypothetical protein